MTSSLAYLGPCRDSSAGCHERDRYAQLQLPQAWSEGRISGGRWIAPDEYFWTPDEFFKASSDMTPELLNEIRARTGSSFYTLSLVEQCSLLGVAYEKLHPADMERACVERPLDGTQCVEEFSFNYFANAGWAGDCGEGSSLHLLMHVVRSLLEEQGIMYHNYWYRALSRKGCPNGIHMRALIDEGEAKLIEHEANSILEPSRLAATYDAWSLKPRNYPLPRKANAEMFPLRDFLAVCAALTPANLASMVKLDVLGYRGAGWPDLTLQKQSHLRFVEVKQGTDKFTHRQAYWIRNYAIPLALDFQVLHVEPSMKIGLRKRV